MTIPTDDPRYQYADILIALAHIDDHVDAREHEFLDGVFDRMRLDGDVVEKMWHTPRTMDVVEQMLKSINGRQFKNSLLKDCYLLAYVDEELHPEESRFIKKLCSIIDIDGKTRDEIFAWVKTAIQQNMKAEKLFGQ